ncbi:uncharacterized protein UTRI_03132_B [Ustilago trichophora]|uniref:Uncharacterized protein n=1 Tax=Ustilago trichophora TaxID=86804 RepID=A0A5C3E4Z9_9BASI|nr:uncharacterized protein UTRI_03132_B [Ustilago trichophora]
MRMSTTPSTSSTSGRLKDDLARLVHQIHKTSTIHNITNDSGISFSGESTASAAKATIQPVRQATGSSIASTITPESAPARSSTVTADAFSDAQLPSSNVQPSHPTLTSGLPILPQLGAGLSFSDASNVVASPSILKANEPFFSAEPTSGTSYSLSPSSSQDFELNDVWDSLARELKSIADVLRSGRHRTPLGTSRLPADCVSALQLWLCTDSAISKQAPNNHVLEAAIEIFRVLANLCIDHDANRTLLDGLNAAPTVLAAVSAILRKQEHSRSTALFSVKILTFLRAAMGAVLNMQLEHIATRQSLLSVDCISTLTSVASHPRIYLPHLWALPQTVEVENDGEALTKLQMGATVTSWAWRVVQEIFDDAKEEKDGQPGTPSDEMDDGDDEEMPPRDVRSILSRRCFRDLLRPLTLYLSVDKAAGRRLELDADNVEELVDSDAEILQIVATLVESCAAEDHEFRRCAVRLLSKGAETAGQDDLENRFQSGLDVLMSFVEKAELPREWVRDLSALHPSQAPTDLSSEDAQSAEEMRKVFAQVKASAARAVVAIAGDDTNMVELFSGYLGFIDRLKVWIRYDAKTRDDLVSCGMLALGNLARSDAHCLSLVQEHGLAPFLASLLGQANDIKVAHGLVSLLKNLSIPVPNKAVIGQLSVIDASVRFMNRDKDMVQPLQFATVGLLKHLCAGVTENAMRLVDGEAGSTVSRPSALNALVDMIQRIDDVPTKMEATRVLVNVVKSLWTSARINGASQAWSEEEIFGARRKMVRRDVIQALAEMVRTSPKYPVLVNEGIIALTLVGSERMGAELVSLSLLAEPTKASAEDDEDEEMGSDNEATALRAPRRRSTVDSSASTSSHPLPPPTCALDMVNLVLARRDARMPPQFASNACALVLSLCHATQGGSKSESSTGAIGQDAVTRVAAKTRPALEQLKDQGPTEALAAAADALEAVSKVSA